MAPADGFSFATFHLTVGEKLLWENIINREEQKLLRLKKIAPLCRFFPYISI